jgi:hypothetical protein
VSFRTVVKKTSVSSFKQPNPLVKAEELRLDLLKMVGHLHPSTSLADHIIRDIIQNDQGHFWGSNSPNSLNCFVLRPAVGCPLVYVFFTS